MDVSSQMKWSSDCLQSNKSRKIIYFCLIQILICSNRMFFCDRKYKFTCFFMCNSLLSLIKEIQAAVGFLYDLMVLGGCGWWTMPSLTQSVCCCPPQVFLVWVSERQPWAVSRTRWSWSTSWGTWQRIPWTAEPSSRTRAAFQDSSCFWTIQTLRWSTLPFWWVRW